MNCPCGTTPETPTPRTDALDASTLGYGQHNKSRAWLSFTRTLERELIAAQHKLKEKGCCGVCWTISWEPTVKDDKGGYPDPHVEGGFMRCSFCYTMNGFMEARKEAEEWKEKWYLADGAANLAVKHRDEAKQYSDLWREDAMRLAGALRANETCACHAAQQFPRMNDELNQLRQALAAHNKLMEEGKE